MAIKRVFSYKLYFFILSFFAKGLSTGEKWVCVCMLKIWLRRRFCRPNVYLYVRIYISKTLERGIQHV